MKRLLLIVAALSAVLTSWGQNTKKMNSIKRSAQYIYAEATMETAAEAFDVANDLLLIQIREYAESKKAFRDKDILIRDIQEQRDSLQIHRGDMVKVFLYVKKSNIINVDNATYMDNTSVEENNEDVLEATTTESNTTPVTTTYKQGTTKQRQRLTHRLGWSPNGSRMLWISCCPPEAIPMQGLFLPDSKQSSR